MRFCTGHRCKSPNACSLEPMHDPYMIVPTTNSLPDGDKGNIMRMPCKRLLPHNCLSICRLNTSAPQSGTALTALQTPRKCSVHNCAPSASGTSRELRSPFVNISFHEQGWVPDHCVTKEQQLHWRMCEPSNTSTMLHESQKTGQGTSRENQGENLPALPCNTSGAVGAKRKTTPLRRSTTNTRTCLVSTQNMHLKTGARQRKDVRGPVSSCSLPLCGRSTKTFPHSWMTSLQIDSLSHWTLHAIVFDSARFSAHRCLMPCSTSAAFANDW